MLCHILAVSYENALPIFIDIEFISLFFENYYAGKTSKYFKVLDIFFFSFLNYFEVPDIFSLFCSSFF